MRTLKFFGLIAIAIFTFTFTSCKKEEAPLPPIGGYNNADEVGKADLVAYWPLNGEGNESLSKTAPNKTSGVTWVEGIKGKAASMSNGYLAYPTLPNLGSNLTSFTVSAWVKLSNNSDNVNAPSVIFSLTRPNEWAGTINFSAETGWMKSTSDSITMKGYLLSNNALGGQDIINKIKINAAETAEGHTAAPNKIGGKWANAVLVWDNDTKLFKLFVNGVKISTPVWEKRGDGNTGFVPFTTGRPVLGAYETFVTGTSNDTWIKGLTGQMDEVRVWKRALTLADIGALYELEKAGR